MPKIKLSNPIREEFRISVLNTKKRKPPKLANPVFSIRVNPDVWRAAMMLADQDALRIEILDIDDVIVHNSRKW